MDDHCKKNNIVRVTKSLFNRDKIESSDKHCVVLSHEENKNGKIISSAFNDIYYPPGTEGRAPCGTTGLLPEFSVSGKLMLGTLVGTLPTVFISLHWPDNVSP